MEKLGVGTNILSTEREGAKNDTPFRRGEGV